MNRQAPPSRRHRGFTLQETVGTLAVIGILASLLIPRVISLVDDAKLVATVQSIQAMRNAAETYFQQHSKFAASNGAGVPTWTYNAYEYWDRNTLLPDGFAETYMRSRLATNCLVRLVKVSTTSTTANILSSVGQLGHLSGFNGNNGYYNFTDSYSAVGGEESGELLWAAATRHHLPARPSRWLAVEVAGRRVGSLPAFRAGRSAGSASGLRQGVARLLAQVGQAVRFLRLGVQPFQACYPVPSDWPVPDPGTGGGTGDSYDNPGADTEIVAPDSSNPAIVVEVVLEGVAVEDAFRLSMAIDGPMQTNWAFFDSLGRVKYDMYDGGGGTLKGVVFVYLAHK